MASLIGTFEYSLDAKNRLVVPPRFREHLEGENGTRFILSLGLDDNLYLYLPSQWEALLANQAKIEIKDKRQQRALKLHFFRSAHEAEMDDQFRILIPPELKKHAGLKRDVVIAGAGNKAEIWDKARFAPKAKQGRKILAQLSADLDL